MNTLLMTLTLVISGWFPAPPVPGEPVTGTATWYGSTSGYKTHCYGGYRNTCTPYASGERVMYAAMGYHKNRKGDLWLTVTGPRGSVKVLVRDNCHGCREAARAGKPGHRLIDLSPAAFLAACGPLSRGVCKVSIVLPADVRPADVSPTTATPRTDVRPQMIAALKEAFMDIVTIMTASGLFALGVLFMGIAVIKSRQEAEAEKAEAEVCCVGKEEDCE